MKTCFPVAALLGLLFVVALSPAVAAESNPFGLDLDKRPCTYEDTPYWYSCGDDKVPKPHPDFNFYDIQYVEGVGICAVKARGAPTTWRWVDAIAKQLKRKYGVETKKVDEWLSYSYEWRLFKPVGEVIRIYLEGGEVEFEFKRKPQCDAIIEKARQDAF